MVMKMLSALALTAALIATAATAQDVGADGPTVRKHNTTATHHSSAKPVAKSLARTREQAAEERGRGSYASTPATKFDGSWSVLIQTRSGACDSSYRYGVEISNGQVLNAGGEPVALSGRVAPNGTVSVSVAAGDQQAVGSGRLSATSGGGIWRGQGSRGVCSGTWEAERRS
jgi:hypothetical protein